MRRIRSVGGTVDAGAVDGTAAAGAELDVDPRLSSELPPSLPQPAAATVMARTVAALQMRHTGAPYSRRRSPRCFGPCQSIYEPNVTRS